jgi:hypothetical protein
MDTNYTVQHATALSKRVRDSQTWHDLRTESRRRDPESGDPSAGIPGSEIKRIKLTKRVKNGELLELLQKQ